MFFFGFLWLSKDQDFDLWCNFGVVCFFGIVCVCILISVFGFVIFSSVCMFSMFSVVWLSILIRRFRFLLMFARWRLVFFGFWVFLLVYISDIFVF